MKKLFLLGALCLAVAFVLPAIAAQPKVPADGIEMHKTAKTVIFNHSTHGTVECASCHHPVEGKEDYRSCSTAGCHDNFDRKDKSINGYYQMIHKTKGTKYPTCVACHTEQAGADKEKRKELAGCAKSKCHP